MELFYSRWKLGVVLGFVVSAFLYSASDILRSGADGRDWFFVSVFAWICGWLVVRVGGRILNPEPGLVVNEEGVRFAGVFEDPVVFGWDDMTGVRVFKNSLEIYLNYYGRWKVRPVKETFDINFNMFRRSPTSVDLTVLLYNKVPVISGEVFKRRGFEVVTVSLFLILILGPQIVTRGTSGTLIYIGGFIVWSLIAQRLFLRLILGEFGVMDTRWGERNSLILKEDIEAIEDIDDGVEVLTRSGRRAEILFKGLGRPWSFRRVDMSAEVERWREQTGV
ncbi:hypothetical protein C0431_00605 [bacterium]|nr:hypothetical protein [bacterium]